MTIASTVRSLGKRFAALFLVFATAAALLLSAAAFTQIAYADELITSAECTVTAPVASTSPDFVGASADPSKYTVTVNQWYLDEADYPELFPSDVFDGNKRYRVRALFEPKEGYCFDDSTTFTINGKATSPVSSDPEKRLQESDQLISTGTLIEAANSTVKTPTAGVHPDFAPVSDDPSRYSVAMMMWYLYDEGYPELAETDTFENGKRYCVRILFTPEPGYYFDDDSKLTINGKETSPVGIGSRVQELSGLMANSRPLGYYVVTAGSLNVRSNPWYSATRIAGISYGDVVEAVKVEGIWLGLAPDASCWVNGNYLALTDSATPTIKPTEYTVNVEALNVRSAPDKEADNRIGGYKLGDKVLATNKITAADGNEWLVLDYYKEGESHKLGYVVAGYTDAKEAVIDLPVAHIAFPDFSDDIASHAAIDPSFSQPLIAHDNEASVSGENAYMNDDGDVVVTVFPDDGTNFDALTVGDIELPAGSSYTVKEIVRNIDGSIAVVFSGGAPTVEPDPSLSVTFYVANAPDLAGGFQFGETVKFGVTVINKGDTDLTDVVVTCGISGEKWVIGDLAYGGTKTHTFSYVATYADVEAGSIWSDGAATANNPSDKETAISVADAHTDTIPTPAALTFDLAGGTLDGKTGTVTVNANVGQKINLPDAPTREGYTFKCWKGSEYAAGAEYTVEGDHPFTAEWEKNAESAQSGSGTNAKNAVPATGDDGGMLVIPVSIVSGISLAVLIGSALRRKSYSLQ